MNNQNTSDEYLNSFVDNQLDAAEKVQVFDAISQSEELKERVCELRGLKEAMQLAYQKPPVHTGVGMKLSRPWPRQVQAIAACLLLLIGGVSGWLSHAWSNAENNKDFTALLLSKKNNDAITDTRKIIIHVSSANPAKLNAALDETEGLLETYRHANRQIQIEVVANQRGVDLLRADASAYKQRIGMMQKKYANLDFLVCGQTISKLRNNGESVQLLPHTGIATSAADQINKRLNQGWGYVKI
jgi:uncharacterized protein